MIETVAVLLPTKGRAEQLKRNVETLLNSDVPNGYELLVIVAYLENDEETGTAVIELTKDQRVIPVIRPVGSTAVEGWNQAYHYLSFIDWYVLGADDIVWDSAWLQEAVHIIRTTGAQVIGLNDGHTGLNEYAPHYMVSKDFTRQRLGGNMIPPEYKSWWFDREVCELAKQLNQYAPAWHSKAIHHHPDWGTAEMDDTYREAWDLHDKDRAVYLQRTGKQ